MHARKQEMNSMVFTILVSEGTKEEGHHRFDD